MDLPDDDPEAAEAARVLIARFGKSFQPGEVIYREGEPGTEAYLLEEGRTIAAGTPDAILHNPELKRAYLGLDTAQPAASP